MSESDKDESLADAVFDEAPADAGDVPKSDAPKTAAKKGAAASVAWLALFLAMIAVAGVGYLVVETLRAESTVAESDQRIADLSSRLSTTDSALMELNSSIDNLAATDARNAASIDRLQSELDQRTDLFDSLPPRMSALERSVANLQGVSIDARNTYLVAEAEYYMQIANAQLQLARNPYLASLALEQADDRLLQLADPALTDVRRAISDELAALEVMEKPDIAGVTLTLSSLANVVDSLPMRTAETAADADDGALIEEDTSRMSRAWNAFKDAFRGAVRVTRPDEAQLALLTPEFTALARANLSLQLQAARLALLRGEQQVFEQSLDDASDWLERYFDTTSDAVRRARQTITDIRDDYSSVAPPDISQSLRLLRQYKTLSEPEQ
ncbi:MAG: uroporphyrinogen-III C-methyltransferase [Woeseiaceae bacterium]|nr:uroporphyrinogen-III C-methyltransferase [Woeseiaceae bacterium]